MPRQRASQQAHAAFARIGAAATAPDGDQPQGQTSRIHNAPAPQDHDAPASRDHDAAPPQGRDVTRPRRRRGPVAADAVAFTVRFDPGAAIAVDELTLAMRRAAGRRVDKSELVRALLQLARDRHEIRSFLAARLRDDDTP